MYKNNVPIQKDLHGKMKFQKPSNMGYCANQAYCPITIDEFFATCKSEPILFTAGETSCLPVALLGIAQDENLFLDKKKMWIESEYCPSYVSDYPFTAIRVSSDDDSVRIALAFDEDSKALTSKKGISLFETQEGASEEIAKHLEHHRKRMKMGVITDGFVEKLQALKLLVPFSPKIQVGEEYFGLKEFLVVDVKKLRALPNEIKLELINKGYYEAIIAHLLSLSNIAKLIALKSKIKVRQP